MNWKTPAIVWVLALQLLAPGSEAQAKTAFVLSGGGSKGSFQVGVLKKLYEEGIEPDILIGTSVGAINAAKLAEGQRNSIDELYDIWMSLNNEKDMYLAETWYVETKAFIADLEQRGSDTEALVDAITLPWRLKDAAEKLDKAGSLYNLKPIESRLRYCLDPQKVAKSGKTLRISAVDLSTARLFFIDQNGIAQYKSRSSTTGGYAYPVDLRKAVLASASIPIIFPPQDLGRGPMADGGVREIAPVEMAKELGADQVFVILASSPFGDIAYSTPRNITDIAGRITDILVNEILINDVSIGLGSDDWMRMPFRLSGNATVLYPRVAVHDGMAVDPKLIRINADYGWMVASDVLRGLPREQTAKLLDTAHGIAQAFLTGAELIDEIQRGDWTPAEYGRRRHEAVVKAREPLEEAVRQRQQAGGEIPERLQPLLQGKPLPSVKLPGGSVPDVLGRVGDIAAATLRGLGFKVVQVMGTGSPGMVADQDPRAGQWLTAGCRVTLNVAPGKARPRGPTQIP